MDQGDLIQIESLIPFCLYLSSYFQSSYNGSSSTYNSTLTSSESKVVCICSGLDFVSLTYTYFLAKKGETAERWLKNLRSITHNYKANNVCAMMQLQKQ